MDRVIKDGGVVNGALFALLAFLVVGSTVGQSPEPDKIRVTTWNLEWFANGSAHDATPEVQAQRIAATADVLKKLNPDILFLQEMRDYDACARLGEAIQPGAYQVAICSAFKGAKQQEAIVAKIPAQAAWSESWKSTEGIDPPRGFAFAWFKIGNTDIGVYSLHLKSNRITHSNKEIETAKNIRKREVSIQQLLAHIQGVIGTVIPSIKGLIIGGDFNTNHDQAMFAAEKTLDTLTSAAYRSVFEGIVQIAPCSLLAAFLLAGAPNARKRIGQTHLSFLGDRTARSCQRNPALFSPEEFRSRARSN
jgi:endonuclease/exonuclease/phosphatase family metal-dependent hydrolase